jgi:chromosomal replication initiator protein
MNPYIIPLLKTTRIPAKYFDLQTRANKTELVDVVCDVFKIERESLLSKSRKREFVEARKVVSWVGVEKLGLTLKYVGKDILNGRDHTTVIHAIKSFHDLYETEDGFRMKVDTIIQKLAEIR